MGARREGDSDKKSLRTIATERNNKISYLLIYLCDSDKKSLRTIATLFIALMQNGQDLSQ